MHSRLSRFHPLFVCLGLTLVVTTVLRLYLTYRFGPVGLWNPASRQAFLIGARMDLAAAFALLLPFALWLAFLPERVFNSRFHRMVLLILVSAFCVGQIFTAKVEVEFFNE